MNEFKNLYRTQSFGKESRGMVNHTKTEMKLKWRETVEDKENKEQA